MQIANNPKASLQVQLRAAAELAQFLYPKRKALDVADKTERPQLTWPEYQKLLETMPAEEPAKEEERID